MTLTVRVRSSVIAGVGRDVIFRRLWIVILMGVFAASCAEVPKFSPGRVGELRGEVVAVEVDEEEGITVVAIESFEEKEIRHLRIAPFTAIVGKGGGRNPERLEPGQEVYARYLLEPATNPPEAISITVVEYEYKKPRGPGILRYRRR